jgi:hypothetical protein
VNVGSSIDTTPGHTLRVGILGSDRNELFGVDLISGAFVRIDLPEDDQVDEHVRRRTSPHVVTFVVGDKELLDRGRPEAIWATERPRSLGQLRPRQLRRLLEEVAASEAPRSLILDSRAASIAYASLDPRTPSMMLVPLNPKNIVLETDPLGNVYLGFRWAKISQRTIVHDGRACAAARSHSGRGLTKDALNRALGFKVRYALIAYARVNDGYVQKVVVSLIG